MWSDLFIQYSCSLATAERQPTFKLCFGGLCISYWHALEPFHIVQNRSFSVFAFGQHAELRNSNESAESQLHKSWKSPVQNCVSDFSPPYLQQDLTTYVQLFFDPNESFVCCSTLGTDCSPIPPLASSQSTWSSLRQSFKGLSVEFGLLADKAVQQVETTTSSSQVVPSGQIQRDFACTK